MPKIFITLFLMCLFFGCATKESPKPTFKEDSKSGQTSEKKIQAPASLGTCLSQNFRIVVHSTDKSLNTAFLETYAARVLSQACVKSKLVFSTHAEAGTSVLTIEVAKLTIDEETNIIHGNNITEYYSVCELDARVKTAHGAENIKPTELLSFNEKETVLKRKEGTVSYESPTLALDESLNFNSMFGKSVAGKVFDRLLHEIAKKLCTDAPKSKSPQCDKAAINRR